MSPPVEHDAIVLAGGRGERLGGVDKSSLVIGGQPLLGHVLAAASAARTVVVVGRVQAPDGVMVTSEDPPGGGPVAGIAAGMAALGDQPAPWVLVLAVDQPGARPAALALLAAIEATPESVDALCHVDRAGHEQWLLTAYRTRSLQHALLELGDSQGVAVRRLAALLRFAHVAEGGEFVGDIDTWADAEDWERRLSP